MHSRPRRRISLWLPRRRHSSQGRRILRTEGAVRQFLRPQGHTRLRPFGEGHISPLRKPRLGRRGKGLRARSPRRASAVAHKQDTVPRQVAAFHADGRVRFRHPDRGQGSLFLLYVSGRHTGPVLHGAGGTGAERNVQLRAQFQVGQCRSRGFGGAGGPAPLSEIRAAFESGVPA